MAVANGRTWRTQDAAIQNLNDGTQEHGLSLHHIVKDMLWIEVLLSRTSAAKPRWRSVVLKLCLCYLFRPLSSSNSSVKVLWVQSEQGPEPTDGAVTERKHWHINVGLEEGFSGGWLVNEEQLRQHMVQR